MQDLREKNFNEAIMVWQSIVDKRESILKSEWSNYDFYKANKQLLEAVELDPEHITALMLLKTFIRDFFKLTTISLADMLKYREDIDWLLGKANEIEVLLDREPLVGHYRLFQKNIIDALSHYGVDSLETVTEANDLDTLSLLRRDALRSISNLRLDQFLAGTPREKEYTPVYMDTVFQWWNINSLLRHILRMPDGISLHLIRDPLIFSSYFIFAMKNGGNVYILSDKAEEAHPLQGKMSRRPDRDFNNRAARNWFPYQLLDIKYDEVNEKLYASLTSSRTDIAAYQEDFIPLAKIKDLDSRETIWITMMFDLIHQKYWIPNIQAEKLSYTGDMINEVMTLSEAAKYSLVPVSDYQPLDLDKLTLADVSKEDEDAYGKLGHPNKWLEERYKHLVTESSLNTCINPKQQIAIEFKTGEVVPSTSPFPKRNGEGQLIIEGFNATSFGSKEDIARDRKFIARVNYANQIDFHARKEYEKEKGAVKKWYEDRIKARIQELLPYFGNPNLFVGGKDQSQTFGGYRGRCGRVYSDRRYYYRSIITRADKADRDSTFWVYGLKFFNERKRALTCFMNDTTASHRITIYPGKPEELAFFAGVKVEELPIFLQHYDLHMPYYGNSILQRIDPMEWECSNPWVNEDYSITVYLSKRSLMKLQENRKWPDFPNIIKVDTREEIPEDVIPSKDSKQDDDDD